MTTGETLFELIRELTRNEKGYFRKHASLHKRQGKNTYLHIFDVFAAQQGYDEARVKQALQRKKVGGSLKAHQHYLFQILVKTLTQFYSAKDERMLICDWLKEAALLRKKGLFAGSDKLLAKAKAVAVKYNREALLVTILHDQLDTVSKYELTEETMQRLQTLHEEFRAATARLDNLQQFRFSYAQANALTQQYNYEFLPAPAIGKIIAQDIFSDESRALTYEAKYLFYLVHGIHARVSGDLARAWSWQKALIEMMERYAQEIHVNQGHFFGALNTYLNSCILLGKKEEFHHRLKTLRAVDVSQLSNGGVRRFLSLSNLELNFYLSDRPGDGLPLLPGIEAGLTQWKKYVQPHQENNLRFNILLLHFLCGNYRAALRHVNYILHSEAKDMAAGVHAVTKLLNLLTHYRLENFELLEYLVATYEKDTARDEAGNPVADALLRFLKRRMREPGKTQEAAELNALQEQLEIAAADKRAATWMNVFDFRKWVTRQLQERSGSSRSQSRVKEKRPG